MRWFEKPLVSQCSESRDASASIKEPLEKALEWGPREELTGLKLTADGPLLKPLLPLSIHTNALHSIAANRLLLFRHFFPESKHLKASLGPTVVTFLDHV